MNISETNLNKISFKIERVYVKDVSFEVPNAPNIFQESWDPKTICNLKINSDMIKSCTFEVGIQVLVTVKTINKIVFICEVHQAGIFFISDIKNELLVHCLNVYCPSLLFPYARECVSNLVCKSSFPNLNLDPVNFEDMYLNSKKI